MSETEMGGKWTPGPWQVIGSTPSDGFDYFEIKAHPSPMMRGFTKNIVAIDGPQSSIEQQANARLIAASPAMADALEYILADVEPTEFALSETARNKARAALKLAKGESDMAEVELKQCPFCGNNARKLPATYPDGKKTSRIQCERCGCHCGEYDPDYVSLAIEWWNTRVDDNAVAKEREACAKIADGYREEASVTVFTLENWPERDEWINKGDAAVEIASAIRARSTEGGE